MTPPSTSRHEQALEAMARRLYGRWPIDDETRVLLEAALDDYVAVLLRTAREPAYIAKDAEGPSPFQAGG